MLYRPLGKTGIEVSVVSFGAGPVSALMTSDRYEEQRRVVRRAVELGINWFDTAATYGDGRSEENLGRALAEFSPIDSAQTPTSVAAAGGATADDPQSAASGVPVDAPRAVPPKPVASASWTDGKRSVPVTCSHVATKVRIPPDQTRDLAGYVLRSLEQSLARLRLSKVTLLQVHNAITPRRGELPTSLAPEDVLGPGGVLEGMLKLQRAGLVEHLGITGLGDPASLARVLASGHFATVQAPYNLLNPSAGRPMPAGFREANLGNLFETCQRLDVGVFAIRVFAGGALAGQPPSAHTRLTKFFPLDLYERDQAQAAALMRLLPEKMSLPEVALRFAIAHPGVTSALIGFASAEQVEQAAAYVGRGPLPNEEIERLRGAAES
jgi:aryl-alcohol dehydrogenase-like predicted oxidoreductase